MSRHQSALEAAKAGGAASVDYEAIKRAPPASVPGPAPFFRQHTLHTTTSRDHVGSSFRAKPCSRQAACWCLLGVAMAAARHGVGSMNVLD